MTASTTSACNMMPHAEILERIRAERRSTWPEGAVECRRCGGSGQIDIAFIDGMPVHTDCPSCHYGYHLPRVAHPLTPHIDTPDRAAAD